MRRLSLASIFLTVAVALFMGIGVSGSGASSKTNGLSVNINDFMEHAENIGLPNENWQPAIQEAINYAAANGYSKVLIPSGTYLCEPDQSNMEPWEVFPVIFQLPDADLIVEGEGTGTILKKGNSSATALAMFRTTFSGTRNIQLRDLHIEGVGNPGSYSAINSLLVFTSYAISREISG